MKKYASIFVSIQTVNHIRALLNSVEDPNFNVDSVPLPSVTFEPRFLSQGSIFGKKNP